jgi:hypothetical protein
MRARRSVLMKKWAIATAAAVIALGAVAGIAFALSGGEDEPVVRDTGDSSEVDGGGDGGGAAGICLEGATDCIDTIDNPPDACIQIFPTPPECADPDSPVTNEPPAADAPPPPNSCTFESNPDCEKVAVELATEDLAGRLGSADGIVVISVEFVQWPDACLGISNPDVACAEIITPGYRIALGANGQTYEYHTDTGSRAALVE